MKSNLKTLELTFKLSLKVVFLIKSGYNELKASEKVPIYSSYFEYLKKAYPEETKDFEPNHVEPADFCRSLDAINNKNLNLLRETVEDITQEKWVENNCFGNYYYVFRYEIKFILETLQSSSQCNPNIMEKTISLRKLFLH